jgi:hypothetical protein
MTATFLVTAQLRLLARSRLILLINAAAALWVLGQVVVRAVEASAPVSAGDVLANLTDGTRGGVAAGACITAAYLMGSHWDPHSIQTQYLAGVRRVETGAGASIACFLLSAGVLALVAGAALAATPLLASLAQHPLPMAPAPTAYGDALPDLLLTLLVGAALWTILGGAIGACAAGRAFGTGAALLLFSVDQVLERVAATYPAVRSVWALSPAGSVHVLLTGRSIPDLPQSSVNAGVGVAGVVFWVVLLWGVAAWRSWDSGRGRRSGPARPATVGVWRGAVPIAAGLGVTAALLAGGWLLPPHIVGQVPWRYTYQWLHDVAAHNAPDDVTRQMLSELAASGVLRKGYFVGDGYQHAVPYAAELKTAAAGGTVFNVTSASRPGEVAIFVTPGGSEQLTACLTTVGNAWRIRDLRKNLTCEGKRDG